MLNDNDKNRNWDFVYSYAQKFVKKEGEKLYQDETKQKGSLAVPRVQCSCQSLLNTIITKANSGEVRLTVSKLIDSVIQCLESSYLKKYFGDIYLTILVKHVLSVRKYWGQINKRKWQEIFTILKDLYENSELDKQSILKSLHLTIKNGTLHSSLSLTFRHEFSFIKSLCVNIKLNKYSAQQEIILQLLLSFSTQLAKECRMACCRLGEDIVHSIIDLYEPRYENHGGKKSLIFDNLLLQLRLHHPRGVTENSDSAFACNWTNWKALLRSMYSILSTEVEIIKRPGPVKSGNKIPSLWPNFLSLFVEVCKQVFSTGVFDITQASVIVNYHDTCSQPLSKKARVETGVSAIIFSMQHKGNWPWLCILAELLSTYPEIAKPDDFLQLLKVSASMQAECKDLVTRHYLYKLLTAMVLAQDALPEEYLDVEKIDSLWSTVWETSLRSVGLNQNEDATHKLLQVMLYCKKSPHPLSLLSIYTSGVLNISVYSVETLNVLCQTITLPENIGSGSDTSVRKYIMQFVLGLNTEKLSSSAVFSEKISAQVLSGLLAKSWPYMNNVPIREEICREYNSIEESYILSSFEGGLVNEKSKDEMQKNQESTNCLIHSDSFSALKCILLTFCDQLCENHCNTSSEIQDLINGIILILRVLSELMDCHILTEHTLLEFIDVTRLFNQLHNVIDKHITSDNADVQVLKKLQMIFSIKFCQSVSALVREVVSVEFLKIFFGLLNSDTVDRADDTDEDSITPPTFELETSQSSSGFLLLKNIEKLQLVAVRILAHFICVPEVSSMNQKQKYALETLCEQEFDPLNSVEFETTVYFLKTVTICKLGTLSEDILHSILTALQQLMQAWYKDYNIACSLLQIVKDTLPHVACTESDDLKTNALTLLKPFFERRDSYGPHISLIVANCMGDIIKLNPEWPESRELITNILDLLKSDYHEIRLTAVKNMLNIFSVHSDTSADILLRQEVLFKDTCCKILESFTVNSISDKDQAIDEAANRKACALHAYAALIVASPIWRKKALFAMIQLISEKQINTDLVQKVLSIVKHYIGLNDITDFLNTNLNYLINEWSRQGRALLNFPHTLFKCNSSVVFFTQYINIVLPLLLQENDTDILKDICKELKKSPNELIMDSFANIMSQFLPTFAFGKISVEHRISNDDLHLSNRIFKQLEQLFSTDRITEYIVEKLDEVYIHLLNRFYDPNHFEAQFNFTHVLPEPDAPFYNYEIFSFTLNYIKEKISSTESLIAYCIKNCPNKLEHIILTVTMNLHKTQTFEEKLILLHRYSVLVDCIIPEIQLQNALKIFLIRSITYNLINLIKLYNNNEVLLSIVACKYFKIFCEKCLPFCATIFEKLMVLIISTLVPIAKLDTQLGDECLKVLNFLIVDNSKYLYNSIGSLDPFPQDAKFDKIQQIYEKIKYGNDSFTLEQEIVHFLNASGGLDMTDRTEGLQHLKIQLSTKKSELAKLYADLHKLRGFCGDCEESILHQLICMLVKLTSSFNSRVSLEAARCLGELGPADLTTLVLKPERSIIEEGIHPIELVVGQIVVLLSQYLVHHDIDVAKVASDALYAVLSSKEGWAVTGSATNYGCGLIEKSYILPFIPSKKPTADSFININEHTFRTYLDRNDLWCPTDQCTHADWITILVSELLQIFPAQCFLRELIPMCRIKVDFAETMFPLLIYLCLYQNKKTCAAVISKQIRQFFCNHWASSMCSQGSSSQSSTDSVVTFNRASVQCMLNVINFIRLRRSTNEGRRSISELMLNYLHVAQGAQFCSAYFTSILYTELWCYDTMEQKPSTSTENNGSSLDLICENEEPEVSQSLEILLREGYKKIGDVDAMYGCGTSYILNPKTRVDYYKNLGRWDKVTLHYDSLSNQLPNPSSDLINALKNNSLHYLASHYKTDDMNTLYECAWRLGRWDITDSPQSESKSIVNNYEKYHYFALKSLYEADNVSMNQCIEQARICVIQSLSHASLESSKSLYKPLSDLQLLQEIENVAEAKTEMTLPNLFQKWKLCNSFTKNEFEYVVPIKMQRITMFNDIWKDEESDGVKSYLADMYLQLAEEARMERFYHVAQRSLNNISNIEHLSSEIKGKILFQQAQLSWIDDKTSGRHLLRHLLDKKDDISQHLYAIALKLYGNWMVETRSENASSIIENYFEKSLKILQDNSDEINDVEIQCEALDSLARFADAQYQHVSDYIQSAVFKCKVATIKKFGDLAKQIHERSHQNPSNDERRAISLYERQRKIDETEVNNAFREKDIYLTLAVREYLRLLEYSDSYNLKVFRILSLSVANKTHSSLLVILEKKLTKIASYKYIPLLPQLVPHIGNQYDVFDKIINDLLERCAIDHPHHTLPIILALADSYKDRTFDLENKNDFSETRVQTAKSLVDRLKTNPKLMNIIENMEKLSTALISLAYLDWKKCTERKKQLTVPRNEPINSIKRFDDVLVPTITIDVKKNCNYDNIIGIREFSNSFTAMQGVNAPKKITCLGTDGVTRNQLVKGKDDLRQDAVMQQVFKIMNTLLAKNKQTSKLLIRTYKVVPLSQRSGILEWCENTEPLGAYLIDAHRRYHPSDWTTSECRNQLKAVHSKSHDIKFKKYMQICSKFRPVFHMFFISSYPQPTVWFERRRAYMHSVATTSMVGYILGLGDRHVQNILLDKNTAEVIHIDFGIAFEQGRVLPTPETVPFRLTRDIESGMGVCGIEGVFRRSCEKTMHVLRQHAETVLTILEVLLYDPLYAWTITAAEAYSRQQDDDLKESLHFSDEDGTSVNVTAERALLRLKQKLQGTENGGVCSIEGQVELLLQQARDPVNLSRLYNGWQPYL
ncbi:telomere fusion [Carabus blaptoides fortunei]